MPISAPTELGLTSTAAAAGVLTVGGGGIPAGTLLVARISDQNTTGTYAVADSRGGNTYVSTTPAVELTMGGTFVTVYCVLDVGLLGGDTLTPSRGGGGLSAAIRWSTFTGVSTTTDGTNTGQAGFSATWTTGATPITTNANDLLIGGCAHNVGSGVTDTPSGSFIDESCEWVTGLSAGSIGLVTQYQIVSITGAYTGGGAWGASQFGRSVGQIVAFSGIASAVVLPDADLATTGWTTPPLFSKVNDASDASVITATLA